MALNSEKREKWEIHTVDLDCGEKTEKRGKWDTLYDLEYGEKHWQIWKNDKYIL